MRRTTQLGLIVAIALTAPAWVGAEEKAPRDAQMELRGTWNVIASEANGKKIDLPWQWTFKAEGKAGGKTVLGDVKADKSSNFSYTVELSESKQPHGIDTVYEGPEPALKGTKQLGIFKVEDDKLTLCFSQPGVTERPSDFSTKAGSGFLMRLERSEED